MDAAMPKAPESAEPQASSAFWRVLYSRWFFGVGWTVAGGKVPDFCLGCCRERKVRTPQGNELANGQAGRPDDKCNRKQTSRWLDHGASRGRAQVMGETVGPQGLM